mmetsp:Transcript_54176/g.89682  ORF Transcript_54176/g.89682 Transcript_54176/m.89682 type:complete len:509 (+) Transcript_54176:39-1565(+)
MTSVLFALKHFLQNPHIHLIWMCIRKLVELLQLFTLFVNQRFNWPSDILRVFDSIAWISFDISDATYTAVLIAVCSVITAYVLFFLLAIFGECSDCCECDEMIEYMWWFLGDAVLFGVLFVPFTQILLEIFHCVDNQVFKNPTITCGERMHIFLSIWSGIVLLIVTLAFYLRANSHDVLQHDPTAPNRVRHDVHNLEAYYAFFRLLAMIMVIIVAEASAVAASVCLLLVFIVPVLFTIYKLPFVDMRYNFLQCFVHGFNVWSAMVMLLMVLIGDAHSWIGFVIWCHFILFVLLCCFACNQRLKKLPLTTHDLRESESQMSRAMAKHIDFDDYFRNNDHQEIKQMLMDHEERCIMFRPENTEQFLTFIDDRGEQDLDCIIGYNQASNREIDEENKKWTDAQIDTFCATLRQCKHLVLFRMNGWIFTNEQISRIMTCLCEEAKPNLSVIDIGSNQLHLEDVRHILNILNEQNQNNLPSLKEINLVGNYINYAVWREELIDAHALGGLLVI